MGRRKNRRGRKRNQNVWMQFKSQSLIRTVEDEDEREKTKAKQKEHLQKMKELEMDLLSRTVVVSNVKTLRNHGNLSGLKRFLEQQFGRVQSCEIDRRSKKGGPYPRGRVKFHDKKDAEKVFGGRSLMEARKDKTRVEIHCTTVGHKNKLVVWPSRQFARMVEEDLNETSLITVNTEGISFGHWFPQGKDAGASLPGLEDLCRKNPSTWVEEKAFNRHPIVSINLEKSVVELDFTHTNTTPGSDFDFGFDFLEMFAGLSMEETRTVASFRFKDLDHPLELCQSANGQYSVIVALKHPPRLVSITTNHQTGWEKRTRLTSIDGVDEDMFGSCLGYRLTVSSTEANRLLMNTKVFGKLKNFRLFREELDSLQQAEPFRTEPVDITQRRHAFAKLALPAVPTRTGLLLQSILDNTTCCWFDLIKDTVNDDDLADLVLQGDTVVVERVLAEMRDMHGKTRFPAKMFSALHRAGVEEEEAIPLPVPEFCVNLPRFLLTPCRLCVTGFQNEMSNRLVRKFIQDHGFSEEAFVRLTIGDENGDKLFSDALSEAVATRIKDLVLNGIQVADKTYRFLAYSSSQLKELSLWMVCPERGWSVVRMRGSMGDFSMCPTPSKYAARVGQCFSTTVDVQNVDAGRASGVARRLRVKDDLPDITSHDMETGREMEHSDGVGLIRKELLEDIMLVFPFGPRDPRDVSAIQIRYGGAKGVLMAWDFDSLNDCRCRSYDVCLRPSQVKFKADYDRLEVVNIASHIPYYLNRNVILLGSHHRIPDRTFLNMQGEMLTNLNSMLTDADVAATFIPSLSGPENRLVSDLRHMLSAGLKPDAEPFLFSCLHATRSHHLMDLRKKARIYVEKGAVLIGGIDELGLIPEGCVFVQVRGGNDQTKDEFKPLEGLVMVTKHPVMHPGDVRMLVAVDIPELRDKKNVVLFSQHGERPEADKMSGSDLDGDQFAVTWDERLFLRKTSLPMDYSPPTKTRELSGITDATLMEHFIAHAQNDNLGRISMLWMDHAVAKKDAGCPECLQLAKLASIAVDFPKSGIPAKIPDELLLRSKEPRAHWREKKGSPSFHCESIVGQLYDQILDEMNAHRRMARRECKAKAGRRCDRNGQILLLGDATRILESKIATYDAMLPKCLGWTADALDEILLEYANDQRQLYESQLIGLMNQYKIKCEGEVVTGCILKYHKLHKRRRHDVSEEIRRQFRGIRNEFRSEFLTAVHHLCHNNIAFVDLVPDNATLMEAGNNATQDDLEADELDWIERTATTTKGIVVAADQAKLAVSARAYARRLAAAYYIATYSPQMHVDGSKSVLYSFPWIVAADVIATGLNEGGYSGSS